MTVPNEHAAPGDHSQSLHQLLSSLSMQDSGAAQLLRRCSALLQELEAFCGYLDSQKKLSRLEFRHFQKDVKTDISAMQKLCQRELKKPNASERLGHAIMSSNLPFLEAVWAAAKRSSNVVSLKRHGQLVDVVVDGGATWIKVSTISESRLLHEMAKQGWEFTAMSDSEDEDDATPPAEDDAPDLPLVKMARGLVDASRKTRHKYRYPEVQLLLTRIDEGKIKEIDRVMNDIRELGIAVTCANHIQQDQPLDQISLERMAVNDFASFTSTLNLDCTILLAIVSDISHQDVIEESWFNRAIRRQIEIEAEERLLPNILWPAMGDRLLLTTHAAAKRMREIVDTIGTETERARTTVLMGDDEGKSREELLSDFAKFSKHEMPVDWQLPIKVVDFSPENILGDEDTANSVLPASAQAVVEELSEINQAVFLYGWATGQTTLTSNRTVAKQVESIIEKASDDIGPDVWVCSTSRSLVAKEKDRRDGQRY